MKGPVSRGYAVQRELDGPNKDTTTLLGPKRARSRRYRAHQTVPDTEIAAGRSRQTEAAATNEDRLHKKEKRTARPRKKALRRWSNVKLLQRAPGL